MQGILTNQEEKIFLNEEKFIKKEMLNTNIYMERSSDL